MKHKNDSQRGILDNQHYRIYLWTMLIEIALIVFSLLTHRPINVLIGAFCLGGIAFVFLRHLRRDRQRQYLSYPEANTLLIEIHLRLKQEIEDGLHAEAEYQRYYDDPDRYGPPYLKPDGTLTSDPE